MPASFPRKVDSLTQPEPVSLHLFVPMSLMPHGMSVTSSAKSIPEDGGKSEVVAAAAHAAPARTLR